MFCKKCGSKLSSDAMFCSNCGYNLKEDIKTDVKSLDEKKVTVNSSETGKRGKSKMPYIILGIGAFFVIIYLAISVILRSNNKLIGEWDWGKLGYFVVSGDNIFLYKDSSKSMSNVFYGTYTMTNGIKTVTGEKVDGMKVIAKYTNGYLDGSKYQLPTPNREYTFEPNNDGTYTITDMVSSAKGIARKVK